MTNSQQSSAMAFVGPPSSRAAVEFRLSDVSAAPRPLRRPRTPVFARRRRSSIVLQSPTSSAENTRDGTPGDAKTSGLSETPRSRRNAVLRRFGMLCLSIGLLLLRRPAANGAAEAIAAPALLGTSWWRPFGEAFTVIFMSAFGDKSWFAIALLAMKHQAAMVLIGALSALTVMTGISCFLGKLMHMLDSRVTWVMSIVLFLTFGVQMLLQSRNLPSTPGGAGGEYQDAEGMVKDFRASKAKPSSIIGKIFSLIMVAEWMDRSMVSTMVLAASSPTSAVLCGAIVANAATSGFAVLGASVVAAKVSERMIAVIAGVLFQIFAIQTLLEGPA